MITFLIGLIVLFGGGALYGGLCQKVFMPDNRKTPAYELRDDVDYVPMKKWKNSLVNLLNIAGTGPILGPIQGILFGPIAFITIPIGCVIGGAVHDYFNGMICTREGGIQMPEMIRRFQNKGVFVVFTMFICLTLFLCGVVFIYTPADILATQVFDADGQTEQVLTWILYGVIFIYYLIATVLPIDKIIGKIYPIFGAVLIVSAVGIFVMLLISGGPLVEIWDSWSLGGFDFGEYFKTQHFIPVFFVTVACGIMSGFHSSQTALVSRTLEHERDGRMTFYNMMILEGFIAMIWAAGTMAVIGYGAKDAGITMQFSDGAWGFFRESHGVLLQISPASVVGIVCKKMLGSIGGIIALAGVIILPISSGDTALRSLRLTIAETFHLKQKSSAQRMRVAIPLFALVLIILIWAKGDPNGFNSIWRYFGWANQTVTIFATSSITIYLMSHDKMKYAWIPMIPLAFYSFITTTYLLSAPIGPRLDYNISLIIAGIFTSAVLIATNRRGNLMRKGII